jgi:hypothetical protein
VSFAPRSIVFIAGDTIAMTVLSAGARPRRAALDEQTWERFSEPLNSDSQAAFHLVKGALTMPLSPGRMVVVVSSGAAIDGSPLSGGYALDVDNVAGAVG